MANTKISNLTALGAAPALADLLVVVDVSASETKRMTVQNLIDAVDGNANVFTAAQSIAGVSEALTLSGGVGGYTRFRIGDDQQCYVDFYSADTPSTGTQLSRLLGDVAGNYTSLGHRLAGGSLRFETTTGGGTRAEAGRFDASQYLLLGYTSSNGAYRLQVNSQIFATNATVATSDERVKTNVATLADGLTAVLALRPVTFDFVEHPVHNFATERQVGFIAQEVAAALAGADYVGSVVPPTESEEQLKGMAAEKVVALLVRAVQQLDARVVALEQ